MTVPGSEGALTKLCGACVVSLAAANISRAPTSGRCDDPMVRRAGSAVPQAGAKPVFVDHRGAAVRARRRGGLLLLLFPAQAGRGAGTGGAGAAGKACRAAGEPAAGSG